LAINEIFTDKKIQEIMDFLAPPQGDDTNATRKKNKEHILGTAIYKMARENQGFFDLGLLKLSERALRGCTISELSMVLEEFINDLQAAGFYNVIRESSNPHRYVGEKQVIYYFTMVQNIPTLSLKINIDTPHLDQMEQQALPDSKNLQPKTETEEKKE